MVETLNPAANTEGYARLVRGIFGLRSDEELIEDVTRGTRRFNKKHETEHPIPTPEEVLTRSSQVRQRRDRLDLLLRQPQGAFLLMDAVDQVMDVLSDYERRAISLRFGLEQASPISAPGLMSLEKVGLNVYDDHQVTRERARQIIAKATRRLRLPSRSRRILLLLDDIAIPA